MKLNNEKGLIIAGFAAGTAAIAYGIAKGHDPVFIIGLCLVLAAYLALRKALKRALKEKK